MEYHLDVAPRITKELLLSKNSQEAYFEHYLGVHVKKGLFCCPPIIRVDNTPTCAFYKNSRGNLIFKDFAGLTFGFVDCVMYIFSCSYYKALKIIANDFGIIKTKAPINEPKIPYSNNILKETTQANIQVEIQEFSKKELDWWLSFGISLNTLKKYKVFSIKHIFLNGNYHTSSSETSPIFGYYKGKNSDDLELWRLYMPNKIKYRFLSNWKSNLIQGSNQLPKTGSHCFIIKSLKDTMNFYEFGLNAIAPTSENVMFTERQVEKINLRFDDNIILFFDNDLPGVKGAHKYKKKYNIRCIFIKRKYAKDITDLYKKVSSAVFWTIIDEINLIVKDKMIRQTKHFYVL